MKHLKLFEQFDDPFGEETTGPVQSDDFDVEAEWDRDDNEEWDHDDSDSSEDFIVYLPGDDDFGNIDLNDEDEFIEYRDDICEKLESHKIEIVDIIGEQNIFWWDKLVNSMKSSDDYESWESSKDQLRSFLQDHFDVAELNSIFKLSSSNY